MKKTLFLFTLLVLVFYFASCEKEAPTQENITSIETNQPLVSEKNPVKPDIPEATVAINAPPLRKDVATVTTVPTLVPATLSKMCLFICSSAQILD